MKKEVKDFNTDDSKKIVDKIKKDRYNADGFINLIKRLTNKNYIYENKFVLISIVSKEKNFSALTVERTSIGYILPDNRIYDFVSAKIFHIYELYKEENKIKHGFFALINNVIFKNSKNKIKLNIHNVDQLISLFDKYIENYKKYECMSRKFDKENSNEEHIPVKKKKLTDD